MDAEFWHIRWRDNRIGFHQAAVSPILTRHFGALALPANARVFLPLCGKTQDISWLLDQGFRVTGAELSPLAIQQLFEGLGLSPEITDLGALQQYSAKNIDIFVGDIFDINARQLGPVDAVFDRAALVALPPEMRGAYAAHMAEITDTAPQFLICFEYDQTLVPGPPFSVPAAEVTSLYGPHYSLTEHYAADVAGGLKGVCSATERVWLLR